MKRYLFVGEKRSPTAIRMGVTWEDGRLCAKNLHEALLACGIAPLTQCTYTNAFNDDGSKNGCLLDLMRPWIRGGGVVVALGQRASRMLYDHGIEHMMLTHPAARGSIRKRERYQEHVRAVLIEERRAQQPGGTG
jgi:hypothetical protein